MILSQTALVLIGLLLAAWTLAAGWAIAGGAGAAAAGEAGQRHARRLARMVDELPGAAAAGARRWQDRSAAAAGRLARA